MSTEKKDIREYLHYYIGCEVMTTDGVGWLASVNRDRREMDSLLLNNRVTVHFKTIRLTHNSVDGYDKKRNYGDYLISGERYFPINATDNTEPEFTMPGGVKPLLYRLKDINYAQLLAVAQADNYYKFNSWDEAVETEKNIIKSGEYRPQTFHKLISMGFWMWGNDWFDEGYIIDKKTLKQ